MSCKTCGRKNDEPCGAGMPAAVVACAGMDRIAGIKRPGTKEAIADIEANNPDPYTKRVLERYHSTDYLYE